MANFDARFQLDILVKAALDPKFRKRVKRHLEGFDLLDARHTWLWGVISRLGGDDILTPSVIGPDLKRVKADDREDYATWVKTVLGRTVMAPELALRQVSIFRQVERMRGAIDRTLDLMDNEVVDLDEIREMRQTLRDGIRSDGADNYKYTDVYEGFDERQLERLRQREDPTIAPRIPSLFMPSLDKDLEGGIGPGEVGMLAATTSRGKSSVALALAISAARQRFETVVIATEMNVEQQAVRADSNILSSSSSFSIDVTQGRLQSFGFSDEEAVAVARQWRRHPELAKRLRLVAVPVKRCTMDVIEEALDHAEDDWGKPIRLLIMDSGDHIKPRERAQDRRNRESEGAWELKSLAQERGIAIWDTTHAAKAAVNRIAKTEDAGESYDKSRITDIFASINATAKQEIDAEFTVRLGKNRRGGKTMPFGVRATWNKTSFIEISPEPDTDDEEDDDPDDEEDS